MVRRPGAYSFWDIIVKEPRFTKHWRGRSTRYKSPSRLLLGRKHGVLEWVLVSPFADVAHAESHLAARFDFKILNMLASLEALLTLGICVGGWWRLYEMKAAEICFFWVDLQREMPVMGFIRGFLVVGIIVSGLSFSW